MAGCSGMSRRPGWRTRVTQPADHWCLREHRRWAGRAARSPPLARASTRSARPQRTARSVGPRAREGSVDRPSLRQELSRLGPTTRSSLEWSPRVLPDADTGITRAPESSACIGCRAVRHGAVSSQPPPICCQWLPLAKSTTRESRQRASVPTPSATMALCRAVNLYHRCGGRRMANTRRFSSIACWRGAVRRWVLILPYRLPPWPPNLARVSR